MEIEIIRDLGNGLVLRRASQADADALAQFNGSIFGSNIPAITAAVGAWAKDMTSCPHPTMTAGDFTIVEDTRTHKIVSSLCLISQTWSYAGISFGVGRPELVGTDPDYRNRGLVRAQFEEIHRWSAERGQLLQCITGIPYYYRQFGYEYALPLSGRRSGTVFDVPALKDGESESLHFRPAGLADIPYLEAAYRAACKRSLVACVRDASQWRYELEGRSPESMCATQTVIIERLDGQPVGYLVHAPDLENGSLNTIQVELDAGSSWLAAMPPIMRYLKQYGQNWVVRKGGGTLSHLSFDLGFEHPFYEAAGQCLPRQHNRYGWYVRVADIPGFLRQITPVLEQRLADSLAPGYTGELKLSFFRRWLLLRWAQGKLTIDDWHPMPIDYVSASFPDLTFLQLLFGFRNLDELVQAFPDCMAAPETALILNIMFPKLSSNVWPFQ